MATVVVGFVPKQEGEAALRAAIDEVGRLGGRLVVVTALRQDETDSDWIAKTQSELAAARERLDAAGVDYVVHESETDAEIDAADDLTQVARDEDADLVVIGIRRRTATGKLILGSQAQRILLDAPCPVLVVKPE
ncbi:MAG: universal stress protein [Nocardioides sp.]|uniref:universal stress protein n=1 Tax=Nocardioides nematodiphilus TaxID=2849669 RepID=UPI001CDA4B90|nr:universal stress protein [Nocardioides nematodiphilus]MCA1982566.1 universal stress protein [Nocardioides nematodiphilus]